MNFYLQTTALEEFLEVNQYLSISGVYLDLETLAENKADLKETIVSFLEYMSDEQQLILPILGTRFRGMLDQVRSLQAISKNIRPCIPAITEGTMTIKACKTLQIPVFLGPLYGAGQLLLLESLGTPLVLDLGQGRFENDAQALLEVVKSFPQQQKNWIALGIENEQSLLKAVSSGLSQFVLEYRQFSSILLNPVSTQKVSQLREEWVMAYLKEELL